MLIECIAVVPDEIVAEYFKILFSNMKYKNVNESDLTAFQNFPELSLLPKRDINLWFGILNNSETPFTPVDQNINVWFSYLHCFP